MSSEWILGQVPPIRPVPPRGVCRFSRVGAELYRGCTATRCLRQRRRLHLAERSQQAPALDAALRHVRVPSREDERNSQGAIGCDRWDGLEWASVMTLVRRCEGHRATGGIGLIGLIELSAERQRARGTLCDCSLLASFVSSSFPPLRGSMLSTRRSTPSFAAVWRGSRTRSGVCGAS